MHFDYNDYDVKLALVADGTRSFAPELSLLANDFQFSPTDIDPEGVFTGTVIFFVPEGSNELLFRILGSSKAYELNLKITSEVENGN